MIERTEYLEELKRWKDKDLIKVITGIRRCGKSTLFELFINYLKENKIDDDQIIHINLEDANYDFFSYRELYDYIIKKIDTNKNYYVFLDEVQNVPEFQKAVDSLYIKKNIDVYINGSNAYLLSGELATLLSGRYIEIKMLPLSFKEYITAFDDKNYYQLFLQYMKNGGMPGNINILKTNKHEDLIKIIKTTYLRNKERLDAGKKIGDKDQTYFELAEKYLYNELSYALKISYEDCKMYIIECVTKMNGDISE